jgi:hypothetical protein
LGLDIGGTGMNLAAKHKQTAKTSFEYLFSSFHTKTIHPHDLQQFNKTEFFFQKLQSNQQ